MSWSVPMQEWLLLVGMLSMFRVGSFVTLCSFLLQYACLSCGHNSLLWMQPHNFFPFKAQKQMLMATALSQVSGLTVTFVQPPAQNSSGSGHISGLTMTKDQPPAQEQQHKTHAYFKWPTLSWERGSKLCFFCQMDSWLPTRLNSELRLRIFNNSFFTE